MLDYLKTNMAWLAAHLLSGILGRHGKDIEDLQDAMAGYAPIASGVTNGDAHDHSGGDGAQITYSTLGSIPSTFTPASHGNSAHSSSFVTQSEIDSTLAVHTGAASPHSGHMNTSAFDGLAKITVGISAPGSPGVGDLWVDTN